MTSDAELVQIVDVAVADARRRAGDLITCRKGCTHCCIGPFTVTERDLARLRQGLAEVQTEDRARIVHRSREARETMRTGFPGDWTTGRVEQQAEADAFDQGHVWLPCPILDLETGGCALHSFRPVACRLHGPALTINGTNLQHCRLNYVGADADSFRVEIITPEVEDSPLTYIAWAARE